MDPLRLLCQSSAQLLAEVRLSVYSPQLSLLQGLHTDAIMFGLSSVDLDVYQEYLEKGQCVRIKLYPYHVTNFISH